MKGVQKYILHIWQSANIFIYFQVNNYLGFLFYFLVTKEAPYQSPIFLAFFCNAI